MNLHSAIALLREAETRSISPENPTGERGNGARAETGTGAEAARQLGRGWKISPSVDVPAGQTHVLADIAGAGEVQHIWLTTHTDHWRSLVLRAFWDDDDQPAVEVPLGDFFGQGWCRFAQLDSVPIAANPHGGFNSYWPMPFRRHAHLTLTNLGAEDARVYYQVTYELADPAPDAAYFHAQWHRSNPLAELTPHTIVAGVTGRGQYVGTYLAWGVHNDGWWGEGEVKFYLDDDGEFPTICGTGTEDYFGGAWNFDVPGEGYTRFSTPDLGLHQILRPDGLYRSQQRFGMYRWHLPDPIRFRSALRVDVQALGWRSGDRYLLLRDDIASTALFYLDKSSAARTVLPPADHLEVV